MKTKAQTGAGAPSFCWECHRQLQRAPGKGAGLFYFVLIRGRDGNEHRVHEGCVQEAKDNGGVVL